eukprot:m.221972 g.221972  ORF g.221972 m.221972 type:complete len:691 (+) comp15930_c0_seq1:110-2182(+)
MNPTPRPVGLEDLLGETEADGSVTPPSLRKRGKSLSPVVLRADECFPRHYVAVPPAGAVLGAPNTSGIVRSPQNRRSETALPRPGSAGTAGKAALTALVASRSVPALAITPRSQEKDPRPNILSSASSPGKEEVRDVIVVENEMFGFGDPTSSSSATTSTTASSATAAAAAEIPLTPSMRALSLLVQPSSSQQNLPCTQEPPIHAHETNQGNSPDCSTCSIRAAHHVAKDTTDSPHSSASKDAVPTYLRMATIDQWFQGFTDQQRNDTLRLLLRHCGPEQDHLLSLLLAGRGMHATCEAHCRDPLLQLPTDLALRVLSFLDPVSLARMALVCRAWRALCFEPSLWRRHALAAAIRLSPASEEQQLQQHVLASGGPDWRAIAVERMRVHRNWLRGRCTIRTFRGHEQGVLCVQLDSNRIASGSSDATIKVWNTRTNASWSVLTLRGHLGPVRCLHMRGPLLVSGSSDHTIRVWELIDGPGWRCGSCRLTITGHDDAVRCLQSDGKSIVSGSYDSTLRVWDQATGVCRHVLRGHDGPVLSVYFEGDVLVSGGMDTQIKVWSIAQGACSATLSGHRGGVTCVQADVASGRILSGAIDGDVRFWNLATNECVETLDWIRSEGHTGVIRQLQADQWRVVTASDDKTVKVWDLRTRTRLATLRCHTDGVTCVHFTDWALVSGSFDESVKLLDFSAC